MTTTTNQLQHWMRHEPSFIGVFSLNEIPHLSATSASKSLIVNTHTDNLPGEHWIAVRLSHDQAWIFDPLASLPPPLRLCQHLILRCCVRVLHVCDVVVQENTSQTCGQHCVFFLYTGAPASSETSVLQFVSKL
jgi:hypothetical protein